VPKFVTGIVCLNLCRISSFHILRLHCSHGPFLNVLQRNNEWDEELA
jgi:hypothetical protein